MLQKYTWLKFDTKGTHKIKIKIKIKRKKERKKKGQLFHTCGPLQKEILLPLANSKSLMSTRTPITNPRVLQYPLISSTH